MKVTERTKYAEFAQYADVLRDESTAALKRAAESKFKPCSAMTINEFWGVITGNYELLGDMTEPSVLQVYWLKRFADFCDEFAKTMERLAIKNPEMENLQANCVKMSPQESMLLFVREYFGLRSFYEAGEVTIGEYVLARKDRFNDYVTRKAMEAKQLRDIKSKKK